MKPNQLLLIGCCIFGVSLLAFDPAATLAGAGPSRDGADVVPTKVPLKAFPFDLNQVQLLDGPFKHAQDLDRRDLLATDMEVLYYPFRREAKLPTPVKGNDSLNYRWTGHVLGHYLSAAAFLIRNTGDQELKKKADAAVAELAKCQDAIGTGFVGGFPADRIINPPADRNQRVGVPWYCLHKVYAGLLDMYVLTGNKQALEVLKKAADWAIAYTDPLTEQQFQTMLNTEHGGMNEVLANLYAVTGEEKYFKLSERFHHKVILDPFIQGQDPLDRKHANTQFPKFIGVARQYELLGDTDLQKTATGFWDVVVHERSYVTGGNSLGEGFSPKATLSTAVGRNTSETCNEYNMLKLTRILFMQDPKPEYADYFERTLYNQILSTRNPQSGGQLYFQQLQSGQKKGGWLEVNSATQCCFGTGMESNAKYADGIYFHDGRDGLFVNLFIPSELTWKEKGVTLRQETKYPDEAATRFSFECDKPTDLVINIRRPWWATGNFVVTVNGARELVESKPGSYVPLKRTWKTGDTIQIDMPMSFRTEGFKDNPRRFAIMYGPLVMAAVTEPNDRTSAIATEEGKFLDSIKPIPGKPLEFTAPATVFRLSSTAAAAPVTFKPLLRMVDESYAVYWDQYTPAEFANLPAATMPATQP
ncbi:MAG TPA: beta-L-arabinofuranosidase domain-containing protein [Tepidisphaeraceae bacterium]|jgi:hypothetical protein